MRPHESTWQGCFGYWQPLFIRENLLALGHAAWQGYLTAGPGLVVCEVDRVDVTAVDWSQDRVSSMTQFIPESRVLDYLQSLGLETDLMAQLLTTVQTYRPNQEMVLAIAGAGPVTIHLLQRLAIAPPDCSQQLIRRWEEFA